MMDRAIDPVAAAELNVNADEAIRTMLQPLFAHIEAAGVTELVINEPGRMLVEDNSGWRQLEAPEWGFAELLTLATSIGTFTRQGVSARTPILSAVLPDNERIQIVIPPAVPPGTVSITIRKPSQQQLTLEDYRAAGLFEEVLWRDVGADDEHVSAQDRSLCALLRNAEYVEFFKQAIAAHLNISVVGDTGSGKTTFMKTLCGLIPQHERLITIEDVREIFLQHPNAVHLLYSKGGQGQAKVTPADLIASCMRMKPDRVLLAELRGGESYDFLKLLTTGHSGSLTSFHAASCREAIARFVLMAKEHPEAAAYQDVALKRLLFSTMDVVAHLKAAPVHDEKGNQTGKRRLMTEIFFDPMKKTQLAYEA